MRYNVRAQATLQTKLNQTITPYCMSCKYTGSTSLFYSSHSVQLLFVFSCKCSITFTSNLVQIPDFFASHCLQASPLFFSTPNLCHSESFNASMGPQSSYLSPNKHFKGT